MQARPKLSTQVENMEEYDFAGKTIEWDSLNKVEIKKKVDVRLWQIKRNYFQISS